MTDTAILRQAQAQFARILDAVGDDDWDKATPCEAWSIRDLTAHLIRGEDMAVRLLDGASSEEARAMISAPPPPGDLKAAFATAASASARAFDAPGAMELVVHHPIGDVAGSQLLSFRIGDLTLHSWDLARSIGAGETLDPFLVETVWGDLEPLTTVIASIGVFGDGPSGNVGEDAELQLRLLDLTGRRP